MYFVSYWLFGSFVCVTKLSAHWKGWSFSGSRNQEQINFGISEMSFNSGSKFKLFHERTFDPVKVEAPFSLITYTIIISFRFNEFRLKIISFLLKLRRRHDSWFNKCNIHGLVVKLRKLLFEEFWGYRKLRHVYWKSMFGKETLDLGCVIISSGKCGMI